MTRACKVSGEPKLTKTGRYATDIRTVTIGSGKNQLARYFIEPETVPRVVVAQPEARTLATLGIRFLINDKEGVPALSIPVTGNKVRVYVGAPGAFNVRNGGGKENLVIPATMGITVIGIVGVGVKLQELAYLEERSDGSNHKIWTITQRRAFETHFTPGTAIEFEHILIPKFSSRYSNGKLTLSMER